MLKSAVLFSHRKIQFHIFTEDSLKPEFEKQVNVYKWQHHIPECRQTAFWEMHILVANVFLLWTQLCGHKLLTVSLTVLTYNAGIITLALQRYCKGSM